MRSAALASIGCAAVASLALFAPLAAQEATGSTIAARLEADLTGGDGVAVVRVEYELATSESEIEVELLGFAGVTAEELVSESGTVVTLDAAGGSLRRARVPLQRIDASRRRLVARYRVVRSVALEGGGVVATVPVLTATLPTPAEGGGTFAAELTLPTGWTIAEGFPTGLREARPGVYSVELPVVPSLVSVSGRTDGAWRPGVNLVVEVLTALVLGTFLVAGWRYLDNAPSRSVSS